MCSTVCTSDLCVQLQVSPDQICCLVSSAGEDMRRHSQYLDFEQVSHCTCIWMTFWSFLPPVNYSDHTLSFWRPYCHSGFTAVQPQESPKVTYLCSFLFFIYLQKVSSPSSQAKTWRHERSTSTPGPLQPSGPAVAIVDDAAADVIKFLNEYGTTIRVSSSGLWQNVNKEWQIFFFFPLLTKHQLDPGPGKVSRDGAESENRSEESSGFHLWFFSWFLLCEITTKCFSLHRSEFCPTAAEEQCLC